MEVVLVAAKVGEKNGSQKPLIQLKEIYKIYEMGSQQVRASDGVSLTICQG